MNKYPKDLRENIASGSTSKDARYCYDVPQEFQISYTPIRAGIFNIYLFGEIQSAEQFIPSIEVLAAAGENDVVIVHLQTPGGSLEATDTLISAMRDCEARIVVRATGGVHSAGTVILLNADEFTLSENFSSLLHNGSVGATGKFSDWRSEVKHTDKYMERVMRSTYADFLTEAEIDDLLKGVDMWMDGEEFSRRWEIRNEATKHRIEAGSDDVLKDLMAKVKAATDVEDLKELVPHVKKPRKPRKALS